MKSDITNLSQSAKLRDRVAFEVDARNVTPEMCEELAEELLHMMKKEENHKFFCTEFVPLCHIEHVADPLKYKVCF
jgi:hypothetical protein